jgi:hypothetical protein
VGPPGANGLDGAVGASGILVVRSGTVTVVGAPLTFSVTFSTPMANANYSVSLITNGITGTAVVTFGCMWHIDAQSTTGFTFSCRDATAGGTAYALVNASVIAYIALPHQ